MPSIDYLPHLHRVIADIIAPQAAEIDREGTFPHQAIEALGKTGLLGLISTREVGGLGGGIAKAAEAITLIATACASTAMIVTMHYCATSVLEVHGALELRKDIAAGRHLSTLALSEQGSRSHFWAPMGEVIAKKDKVSITSHKSWVTSADKADSYVWSTRPLAGEGASSLWLVPNDSKGLVTLGKFDGLGLRGNASSPMKAEGVQLLPTALLGGDGEGFGIMMQIVLPVFATLNASCSIGIIDNALNGALSHVKTTQLEHLHTSLADLPTIRAYLARAKIIRDQTVTLRDKTVSLITAQSEAASLAVMEAKAAAAEAALQATDIAMRVCGGAAFRKDMGIERSFRDARAASVMAPTSDMLYDFIGKAITGLPLF